MKTLIAILLIVHGLITLGVASGCFNTSAPVQNPAWVNWWPNRMGQSLLLDRLGLARVPMTIMCGVIFLTGGVALIAAGFSLLGWLVPPAWAPALTLAGAGLSLFMLLVYLHPLYLIGIATNTAVLASLLWLRWPAFISFPR